MKAGLSRWLAASSALWIPIALVLVCVSSIGAAEEAAGATRTTGPHPSAVLLLLPRSIPHRRSAGSAHRSPGSLLLSPPPKDSDPEPPMTIATRLLRRFWGLASAFGTRRLGSLLRRGYARAYGDTLFCFPNAPAIHGEDDDDDDDHPGGVVALTIDDGLCRGSDPGASMVPAVRELLREHGARATFFVCSDYCGGAGREDEIPSLLREGHELGNHLQEDRSGYYCFLNETDFARALDETNRLLEECMAVAHNDDHNGNVVRGRIRWYRPPQGVMSPAMKRVLQDRGMTSVLGDAYCDDWAFAERDGSTVGVVAPLMLSQVQPGSIAIFHMPQRGFRESTLDALREFLEGLAARNLRCTTLSEAARFYGHSPAGTTPEGSGS